VQWYDEMYYNFFYEISAQEHSLSAFIIDHLTKAGILLMRRQEAAAPIIIPRLQSRTAATDAE